MLANIFGDWYWVVLAIIVLFGGSQLPKLARNSGEALKEFRKAHADEPQASPAVAPGSSQSALAGAPAAAVPAYPQPLAPQVGVPSAQMVPPTAEERITLTRAELNALLADREARAKADEAKRAQPQ
ncbi:MAG: twin-arginine translocase TatA/TatE family subunit [Acidimicrobiales bacterium]|jgi:TatA/E family protein of Tat protein translocase